MGRFVTGALASATTIGLVMISVGVGNTLIRSLVAHRVSTRDNDINALALGYMF